MKTIDDISISDLLPSSISDDQRVRNSAAAIDPELKRASGSLYLGAIFANVDKLTSLQLDHLAYSFDLTTWRDSWPLNQKRQVAKTVVAQKCRMEHYLQLKKFWLAWDQPFPSQNGGRKIREENLTHLRLLRRSARFLAA